jgi:MFS family permease
LKFMVCSVALAELALVFFGLLPQPFNVFALFFNGLALGCMWGVIFSFIEGRKVTDILASLLGVSMAVSSGMAKSMGLFVVNTFGVTEFWMPALIGGLAFPLLILMGWSLNKLPQPTDEDRALRSERVTLNGEQRRQLFKSYMPLLIMLFFANLFITILRDIKEDFLVNIIDVSTISSWLFAQVDGMVTLIILGIFAMMSLINSNYRVLQVLLAMVIGGAGTISYLAFNYDALQLPTLYWLFLQSLSLYIVYLSFQTLFFERFIACFKIKGNVGFFIATIDFIGYTGTVCVLLFKEFCSPDINWMEFYNQFSGWVGIVCSIAFIGSAIYLMQRYKLERQLRKEEKNKKIIVSPMALTNLKETAENICNP